MCGLHILDSRKTRITPRLHSALAAGRAQGMRKVVRVGYYSPTGGDLPTIPVATLKRLQECGSEDLAVLFSPGTGDRIERSLQELLAEAGLS